jgi:hypothetical protein
VEKAIMTGTKRNPAEPGKRKDSDEHDLDEALDESFPASDPPATSGTSTGAPDHPDRKAPSGGRSGAAKRK